MYYKVLSQSNRQTLAKQWNESLWNVMIYICTLYVQEIFKILAVQAQVLYFTAAYFISCTH